MIKKCTKCGKEMEASRQVCPYCGEKQVDDAVYRGPVSKQVNASSGTFAESTLSTYATISLVIGITLAIVLLVVGITVLDSFLVGIVFAAACVVSSIVFYASVKVIAEISLTLKKINNKIPEQYLEPISDIIPEQYLEPISDIPAKKRNGFYVGQVVVCLKNEDQLKITEITDDGKFVCVKNGTSTNFGTLSASDIADFDTYWANKRR